MNKPKSITVAFVILAVLAIVLSKFILDLLIYIPLDTNNFPLREKWSQRLDSKVIQLSGSEDANFVFARTIQSLYALNAKTGEVTWRHALNYQVETAVAIASSGMVYIADSKTLWALDQKSGGVLWKQTLSESSGWVVDATEKIVLVHNRPLDMHAYDAKTGMLLWKSPLIYRHPIKAYLDGNFVYIADRGINSVDLTTGKIIKTWGKAYIGDNDYSDGDIYYMDGPDAVAFNPREPSEVWRQTLSLSEYGIPTLKFNKQFVFVLDNHSVFELNMQTGRLLWKASADSPVNPSIIGNNLFVIEGFRRVIRVFDLLTGEAVGSLRVSMPQLLFVPEQHDMVAVGHRLFFARGNELLGFAP